MYALNNRYVSKKNLANQAIFIEQSLVKDYVGSQDQVAASFGFNIYFMEIITKLTTLSYKNVKKLEESLLLVFSGFLDPPQKLKKEDEDFSRIFLI